jgi:hypothetical protein
VQHWLLAGGARFLHVQDRGSLTRAGRFRKAKGVAQPGERSIGTGLPTVYLDEKRGERIFKILLFFGKRLAICWGNGTFNRNKPEHKMR